MNITRAMLVVTAVGLVALAGGCAGSSSSRMPVYSSTQVGTPISQKRGEITSAVDVMIQAPSRSSGSPGTGATVGAAAMAGAMSGNPLAIAGAMGNIVGGSAGSKLDNQMGQELTILMEDGQTMVIVQEKGSDPLNIGDKVTIQTGAARNVYGGGTTRVIRDASVATNGR